MATVVRNGITYDYFSGTQGDDDVRRGVGSDLTRSGIGRGTLKEGLGGNDYISGSGKFNDTAADIFVF